MATPVAARVGHSAVVFPLKALLTPLTYDTNDTAYHSSSLNQSYNIFSDEYSVIVYYGGGISDAFIPYLEMYVYPYSAAIQGTYDTPARVYSVQMPYARYQHGAVSGASSLRFPNIMLMFGGENFDITVRPSSSSPLHCYWCIG